MTAIASRNPFDLLSEDGEPHGAPLKAVKTKGAASTAAPAVNISSKSSTSAAAAQIKPKGENRSNNAGSRSGKDAGQKGERKPYVQRAPGPATGEGAIYEKFPKGSSQKKKDGDASGQAARGPRAGRGGRPNNDRHPNSGRRENEKRHGGGNANWGNEEQDMHKLEHLDANNASEALKEYAEGETAGLDANGDVTTPAEKADEEEEEPQLTLEEYKAQQAAKRTAAALPAVRAANKGEEIKGNLSNAKREEEDFYVGKKAADQSEKKKKEAKAKQFLEIEMKFNEAPRAPRGEGFDRRGGRGGSRGGNRGGNAFGGERRGSDRGGRGGARGGRGGHNKSNSGSSAPAPDLSSFPSLQR